jgi:hypothetical protein
MEWIKMKCDAEMDPKIKLIRREYGFAGEGRWWQLCRMVGKELRPSDTNAHATFHIKDWALSLGLKVDNCRKFLGFLQDFCGISLTYSGDVLKISVPKVLELRDSRNRARHLRGSKEEDKESEEEKKKDMPAAPANDQKAKPKVLCPQYLRDSREAGTIPKDFYGYGEKKKVPHETIVLEFKNFIDNHVAKENKFVNWYLAWGTWVRNSIKFEKEAQLNRKARAFEKIKEGQYNPDLDPGLGQAEYLKKQAAETKAKLESGYYDGNG